MVDNAKDLDFVIPKYNWLEYSDNYSVISGSLQNVYRDEINYDATRNNASANKIKNKKTTTSKSFEYKKKINRKNAKQQQYISPRTCCFIKLFE